MKILVVGGGGREHALVWKLASDSRDAEIVAAPGNPGIAEFARCVPVQITDTDALTRLAAEERADLTIVGPEAPLEAGLVDRLHAARLPAFGPTRAAARIETSKRFAKELMLRAGVPTARASFHADPDEARQAALALGVPLVVKASGLAAGKGVVVCQTMEEAERAIDLMLRQRAFGTAGSEILLEEFLVGEELSLFAITDGTHVLPMLPAQDHKRLLEGDLGPNTGGMGAYAPVSIGTPALIESATRDIFQPTLVALREADAEFRGLLYAGLMLTAGGPKVVEFNCRFGDPETEAILPLMSSSLFQPLLAVARGESLAGCGPITWRDGVSVTTVVATAGYPDSPRAGEPVALPEAERDVYVFHSGTRRSSTGALETAGGRVFAVSAVAATLEEARTRSASMAKRIEFPGRQFRSDIGWREARRRAGTS